MGVAGSEVTRKAAQIVLADDKFSTIVGAIKDVWFKVAITR